MRPVGQDPDGVAAVSVLLETFVLSPHGPWAEDQRTDSAIHAEVLRTLTSGYPLWAIRDGLRALFWRATFRPKPAEILAAIQQAYGSLTDPVERARRVVEQRKEAEERERRAEANRRSGFNPSKALEELKAIVAKGGHL